MTFGHGGNIYDVARQYACKPSDITDMSSNINPLGTPTGLLEFLTDRLSKITRLPEIDSRETISNFADLLAIEPERLLAGNGTTQFIYSIPRALGIKKSLVVGPTYSDYQDALNRDGIPSQFLFSDELDDFQPDTRRIVKRLDQVDAVYICNPNNPTGALIPYEQLHQICRSHPKVNFIIDESYLPFVFNAEKESMIYSELENVIVLLSISKIFGIPGIRIGFVISTRRQLRKLARHRLPWSVNSLAQEAVHYLANHKRLVEAFVQNTRIYCDRQRQRFNEMLEDSMTLTLYPGKTPFILVKLPQGLSAHEVWNHLARELIIIRNCHNFQGLSDRFIRVSLKTPEANRLMGAKLKLLVREAEIDSAEGRIACG